MRNAKITKLLKSQIKGGFRVGSGGHHTQMPVRKIEEALNTVEYARKAITLTENGKPRAMLVPIGK